MEAETTAENVSPDAPVSAVIEDAATEEDFSKLLSHCGSCKESLLNRSPKLLSCLHTFCLQCVNSLETGDSGQITCPVCRQVSLAGNMIDNMFLPDAVAAAASAAQGSDAESSHICTGCDDNIVACHYCVECAEWLCEPCAQAHRRVKVTKDHTVQPVDKTSSDSTERASSAVKSAARRRALLCPVHPQEPLKLYCDTCSRLTCRDCQLVEHKDHKYQFVQEAAVSCRELLQSLLTKIKEKQAHIENAKSLIDRRHKEITQKEQTVAHEIKASAMSLISEINLKGRQLIGELQAVCNAKRRQLDQKNTEVRLLSDNLEHGLRFADFLLTNTDDAALLYSRRTLAHQLSAILRTRCEVPNPYHIVDLRFSPNASVVNAISNLGSLIVDGYQYGHRPSSAAASASAGTNGRITSSSAHSFGNSANASSGRASSSSSMTSEQKLQKLQMLIQMRRREQQQRGQQQHPVGCGTGQMDYQQASVLPPDYSLLTTGRRPDGTNCRSALTTSSSSSSHHMAQMPNQSANISSSNQHRSGTSAAYNVLMQSGSSSSSSSSYVPPGANSRTYMTGPISLAQLQDERLRRMRSDRQPEHVTTSLQPIVIQPTGVSDNANRPLTVSSPGSTTDGFCGYKIPMNSNFSGGSCTPGTPSACDSMPLAMPKLENQENESSCMLTDIKKEFKVSEADIQLQSVKSIARSRTPTPRIESTSHDAASGSGSPAANVGVVNGADEHSSDANSQFNLCGPCDLAEGLGNADDMFPLGTDNSLSEWTENMADLNGGTEASEAAVSDGVNVTHPDETGAPSDKNHHHSQDESNEDRNEDYCAVCRNGGDLLCCDNCPRVFHLNCHLPVIASFPKPNEQWLCKLCTTSDESLRLEAPDSRPVITGKRRSGAAGLTEKEHLICERLLLDLFTHDLSLPFHVPVSKSIPNYYKMITRPMDLSKVKSKLNRNSLNHYQTVEEFVADIQLIFANCATFNPAETEIAKAGVQLHAYFIGRLVSLLPYIDVRSTTPVSGDQSDWPGVRNAKRRRTNCRSTKSSSHGGSIDGDAVSSPDAAVEKEDLIADTSSTENPSTST